MLSLFDIQMKNFIVSYRSVAIENFIQGENNMKKMITLLATATLAVSTISFADDAKSNDVLQTIPGGNASQPAVVADASSTSSDAAAAAANAAPGKEAAMADEKATAKATTTAKVKKQHHKKKAKKHKKAAAKKDTTASDASQAQPAAEQPAGQTQQ